ncbi:hypothetical protein GCM10023185_11530 [Hymenobacter saemangeumensis]|uniref:Uncharacterized protein n=1 Tax=Hymenobacter saemangeumensis TaxID=1084522 RepID=A0ABP8I651_9BACT
MADRINATIPPADLARALDHLQQARAILAAHLQPLTPTERKTITKMGNKTIGFMQKLVTYASNTPAFVPAFVDFNELRQDVGVATALQPLEQAAAQLSLDLNSTILVAGAEGMLSASPVYKNIKFMAEQRQPAAQSAYTDLSERYPGRPAKKKAEPTV